MTPIVVVAPVWRLAKQFLRHEHKPAVHPDAPGVFIVISPRDAHNLRGIPSGSGIEFYVVGDPEQLKPGTIEAVRGALADYDLLIGAG